MTWALLPGGSFYKSKIFKHWDQVIKWLSLISQCTGKWTPTSSQGTLCSVIRKFHPCSLSIEHHCLYSALLFFMSPMLVQPGSLLAPSYKCLNTLHWSGINTVANTWIKSIWRICWLLFQAVYYSWRTHMNTQNYHACINTAPLHLWVQ